MLIYVYVLLLYQDNNFKWQETWYIRPEFLKIIPLKGLESNVSPTSKNWLTLDMKFIDFISRRIPVSVNYNLDNEKISSFHLERYKRFCAWSATLTCNKRVFCTKWSICLVYYWTLVMCITRTNAGIIWFLRKPRGNIIQLPP